MFAQTRLFKAGKLFSFFVYGSMLIITTSNLSYASSLLIPAKSIQPLPAEQAFNVKIAPISKDSTNVYINWNALPDYYLYQNKFKLTAEPKDAIQIGPYNYAQNSVLKNDPEFGKVKVFYNDGSLSVPIRLLTHKSFTLHLDYQGCLENLLCYPPKRISVLIP